MKADLLRRAQGRLIESVAESPHNALHAQLAGRGKHDFDQHFTFNAKLAGFRGVCRFRLEENFYGYGVRLSIAASSWSRCGRGHVVKAAGLYCAPMRVVTLPDAGRTIAKACVRDCALHTARPACPVSFTRTGWHVERANGGDGQRPLAV